MLRARPGAVPVRTTAVAGTDACSDPHERSTGKEQTVLCSGAVSEVAAPEAKTAIESRHGGTATYIQSVPINGTYGDQTVREGQQ